MLPGMIQPLTYLNVNLSSIHTRQPVFPNSPPEVRLSQIAQNMVITTCKGGIFRKIHLPGCITYLSPWFFIPYRRHFKHHGTFI